MKIRDIKEYLNTLYPFSNKCEWDNCGLLVGDEDREVTGIGFALDLTHDTLNEAKKNAVELVVTHHPVIFNAQKNFLKGNIAYDAAVCGISIISCHTCYDAAQGGVSDILAETIGLSDISVVETDEKPDCVRMGITEKMTPLAFAKSVCEKLGSNIRFVFGNRDIEKVAVCGGAGGDFIKDAFEAGADAYVTGDIDHHEFLLAEELGITLIAAGHYETEVIAVPNLMEKVSFAFPELECVLLRQDNPVTFLSPEV